MFPFISFSFYFCQHAFPFHSHTFLSVCLCSLFPQHHGYPHHTTTTMRIFLCMHTYQFISTMLPSPSSSSSQQLCTFHLITTTTTTPNPLETPSPTLSNFYRAPPHPQLIYINQASLKHTLDSPVPLPSLPPRLRNGARKS